MKSTVKNNEKLKKSCAEAVTTFEKLGLTQFEDTLGRLKWCIGSYEFDKNPSGLNELGEIALNELKEFKKDHPRKVTKKVIEGLEKSLISYQKGLKQQINHGGKGGPGGDGGRGGIFLDDDGRSGSIWLNLLVNVTVGTPGMRDGIPGNPGRDGKNGEINFVYY